MNGQGPLLDDRTFFTECLDPAYPGLDEVRRAAAQGDWPAARHAFADFLRASLQPERFLSIPYVTTGNSFLLPGETEAQAADRIRRHILVSVGIPMDFGEGGDIDWEANPTYNGYREWTWQLSRLPELSVLAHEYLRTGEAWLAGTAAELYASWMRQALCPGPCDGYQTKCWRTIECGIRMSISLPYALHVFYRTPAFTDDLLTDWSKSLWENGQRLSRDCTRGNWLIMELDGLAHAAVLNPWFAASKGWLAQALDRFERELDRQIYPDGFQYELTPGYHGVVVRNYQKAMALFRAYDVEVPASIPENLRRAAGLEVRLMMPDGTVPSINDSGRGPAAKVAEARLPLFPEDPLLRWAARGEGEKPAWTSEALPWAGLCVMRTGWTAADSWVLFDGGPFGKAHQHEDKLSLLFFTGGKLLLTEGGIYAYDTSEMRRYVLSTRAHNTIRVDGLDQDRRSGYAWAEDDIRKKADLAWGFGEVWDWAESRYDEGWAETEGDSFRVLRRVGDAVHERRVFFCRKPAVYGLEKPFLVAVDRLTAREPHDWEALWHIDGTQTGAEAGQVRFAEGTLAFSAGEADVVSGQETPEWQGFLAVTSRQGDYRPCPCVRVHARGAALRLVTALLPETAGTVEASANPADTRLTIRTPRGAFTLDESGVHPRALRAQGFLCN